MRLGERSLGAAGLQRALRHTLGRQRAKLVQTRDPRGLLLSALSRHGLLFHDRDLLGDLTAQQRIIEHGQGLARTHAVTQIGQHPGHTVAIELGRNRRFLARHQGAGEAQWIGQSACVDQGYASGMFDDRPLGGFRLGARLQGQ
ncbi:hypothetical protein ASC70_20020 [Caulobacter sp. Root343]|nr:hypothetical protein ASC70_20020 [Caulobacter sp. Root343]